VRRASVRERLGALTETTVEFLWPNQRHAIAEILTEVIAPGPAEAILRVGLGTE